MLTAGDVAPAFELPALDGSVSLEEALASAPRGVVLYFYPRASTPGCTTEACDFRDNLGILQSMGYRVVAVSPDKLPALEKFSANHELFFSLASDPSHEVMEQYGAWGMKNSYGKMVEGVIRSTFVIDSDGKVQLALYNVRAKGHVERLIKKIEDL